MKSITTQEFEHRLFNSIIRLCNPSLFKAFIRRTGSRPNICLPETVWDKYLWRKIFDHDPQFTIFSDKLAAKEYVTNTCPDVPFARVLWQGNDIEQAPVEVLTGPGFLKANHACSTNLRLGDETHDINNLRAITQGWLRLRHHEKKGEWGYKNVKPTLFIEEDLTPENSGGLVDLSVDVYGDKVTHFNVLLDHKTDHVKYARFDATGRRPKIEITTAKSTPLPADFELPVSAARICDLAKTIAGGSDHLRIDFMWNGQDLYFGEITVYSQAGYVRHLDKALMAEMTESWDLRRSWFLTSPQKGWRARYAIWLKRTLESADPHSGR